MARAKSLTSPRTFLLVWGIAQGTLRMAIVSEKGMLDISGEYVPLDRELVLALQRHEKELRHLAGIAIVPESLGGFASSRLVLATLNSYAWLKGIPVIAMSAAAEAYDHTKLMQEVLSRMPVSKGFAGQLLPEYAREANTTVSKKKRKYVLKA